jgi:AraC family transcriptional regulator
MKLIIRNMVCDRCKAAVRRVLEEFGLPVKHVDLGEVELQEEVPQDRIDRVRGPLQQIGFDLVDDREAAMIAKIKSAVIQLVHYTGNGGQKGKLSDHLSAILHREYSSIAALFSEVEGITIEQFFLLQRLERVKELIKYGELSMGEIAFQTGFSSVAHLSNQFKKLTGMTPTSFKELGSGRLPFDHVGRG